MDAESAVAKGGLWFYGELSAERVVTAPKGDKLIRQHLNKRGLPDGFDVGKGIRLFREGAQAFIIAATRNATIAPKCSLNVRCTESSLLSLRELVEKGKGGMSPCDMPVNVQGRSDR